MALYQPPPPSPFIGGCQPLAPREGPPSTLQVPAPPKLWDGWQLNAVRAWDPPPPSPFIGERQPLAPPLLPPSLEIVPNPPFSHRERLRDYLAIASLWDPPPPNPFEGARQPLAPKVSPPSLLLVDTPPKLYRVTQLATLRMWDAPPPQPVTALEKLIQEFIVAVAANPPFGQPWLWAILDQWRTSDSFTQARKLSPGIPGQSVDQPPPAIYQQADYWTPLLLSWQPPQIPQQFLLPQTIIISPDNPPFGIPPAWLFGTLGQWQVTPPAPVQYQKLVQEFIAAVAAQPAFDQAWLWGILSQWQVVYSTVQARKLSPGIPGQSIDQPPLISSQRVEFITQVKAWEPSVIVPERQIYLPQPFIVVQVDNPPFGMPPDWLYSVLTASWKPGDPLPKMLAKILQEGAAPVIATGQKEKRKWRRSSS